MTQLRGTARRSIDSRGRAERSTCDHSDEAAHGLRTLQRRSHEPHPRRGRAPLRMPTVAVEVFTESMGSPGCKRPPTPCSPLRVATARGPLAHVARIVSRAVRSQLSESSTGEFMTSNCGDWRGCGAGRRADPEAAQRGLMDPRSCARSSPGNSWRVLGATSCCAPGARRGLAFAELAGRRPTYATSRTAASCWSGPEGRELPACGPVRMCLPNLAGARFVGRLLARSGRALHSAQASQGVARIFATMLDRAARRPCGAENWAFARGWSSMGDGQHAPADGGQPNARHFYNF